MQHTSYYKYSFLLICILFGALALSCERDITLDLDPPESKVVVEGSIETGQPPIILLSRNQPYFGSFDFSDFAGSFERNALVTVSDGEQSVQLDEICYSELSPAEQQLLFGDTSGIPEDFDYCLYTIFDFVPSMLGENGKTYSLQILTEDGTEISASTKIPEPVQIDSTWLVPHTSENYDSMSRVFIEMTDPDTLGNYYRLWTNVNNGPFLPGFGSTFDDAFVNGNKFFFPVDYPYLRTDSIDNGSFGYVEWGDTLGIKLASIDKAAYDWWNVLEYAANSSGPLSSATALKTNIEGGTGVWCGYGVADIVYVPVIGEQ